MCGITGFVGQGNEEILKRMTSTLKRRGPDEQGFFIKENVGLGHRRLSIVDLAGGRQPIFNENKTISLIVNGEIYNFQEMRKNLIEKGHRFKTQSDSEVIVHLYEEKGEEFLKELNGMFAIALWDDRNNKLLLARDRLGQKPLYYTLLGNTLVFGSELKAVIAHPQVKKELDFFALAKYLNYEYVPVPQTIFRNIYKIRPGEYLVFSNREIKKRKYWDINLSANTELSEKECLEQLDQHLERAVKARLMSDVPLGIWLSGGIDSTAIAYYAQKNSTRPIKTFSIGFEEPSFDESNYAQKAADFLKTEHHQKILTVKDYLDLIPRIAEFLDEPLADGSIVPTFLLSKFTRAKVKVALSGAGGDELFMGYPTFQAHKLAKFYQVIPSFLRSRVIQPIINSLPTSFSNFSFDFKLKTFVSGFEYPAEIRDQIWMGSFQPKDFKSLLAPEVYETIKGKDIFENIKHYLKGNSNQSLENRLIYLYLKNLLQEDILNKVDRASMAVALEVRAPFLDHKLVEFINSLPPQYKLKGFTTKYLFKKLMLGKIPKEIVFRPKKGFGAPIAFWIKKELKDFTLDLLNTAKIKREGIFNPVFTNQLLKDHFSGKKDHRKLIWTLMVFEMWQERWGK